MAQPAHSPARSAVDRIRTVRTVPIVASGALLPALVAAAGCSGGPDPSARAAQGWTGTGVNAVSRPVAGAGVTAVTGLRPDGSLETAVFDLAGGERLWTRPATMVGRLSGMGVQTPAVTGAPGGGVVTAVEPRKTGRGNAALVARDARTGAERWWRPVDSTFGPARCGPYVCLSESTARQDARFVALDPATGRVLWTTPGIAEVEHQDASRAVLFRMERHPSLEARDLATGRMLWRFPVERALGSGVNLSGGWAFGATPPSGGGASPAGTPGAASGGAGSGGAGSGGAADEVLVGYLAPYQARKGGPLSPYGFFGLRLTDGRPLWTRKRMLRLYPSANPGVAVFARRVGPRGGFGGFERLDPRTGRTTAALPADRAPRPPWWLSFPADLSTLAFVTHGRPGAAYRLGGNGEQVTDRATRTWSFCTMNPPELKITGLRGFYPAAPLCAYDVSTGRRAASPGPPPAWYTGSADGWRVWRDERGAVHGVRDGRGTVPGMYGA